jgi:hypothetical protein
MSEPRVRIEQDVEPMSPDDHYSDNLDVFLVGFHHRYF